MKICTQIKIIHFHEEISQSKKKQRELEALKNQRTYNKSHLIVSMGNVFFSDFDYVHQLSI